MEKIPISFPGAALLPTELASWFSSVGATRLADLTDLDRFGVPVWQVVRPASRSLSVHLGRGSTHVLAIRSAMGEALECAAAEQFDQVAFEADYKTMCPALKPTDMNTYLLADGDPVELNVVPWSIIPGMDCQDFAVPFDCVSLDYTRPCAPAIRRCSNGLASHDTDELACFSALLELIERDALYRYYGQGWIGRDFCAIRLDSLPGGSSADLIQKLCCSGVGVEVLALHARVPIAAFQVILSEGGSMNRAAFERAAGSAAHPDPEVALERALLEAVQGRVGAISGGRDDLDPCFRPRVQFPYGPPRRTFAQMVAGKCNAASSSAILSLLRASGVGQVGCIYLPRVDQSVHVVRCFAPQLRNTIH